MVTTITFALIVLLVGSTGLFFSFGSYQTVEARGSGQVVVYFHIAGINLLGNQVKMVVIGTNGGQLESRALLLPGVGQDQTLYTPPGFVTEGEQIRGCIYNVGAYAQDPSSPRCYTTTVQGGSADIYLRVPD